ncbi:MAG: TldD/PmbA family protein [Bacillota bacterium]
MRPDSELCPVEKVTMKGALLLFSRSLLLEAADAALSASRAEQTQVNVNAETFHLTRFNNNQIHQTLTRENVLLTVKVIDQNRVGIASTSRLTKEAIQQTAEQALLFARLQQPNPNLGPLPSPRPLRPANSFIQSTAEFSAEQRAEAASKTIEVARSAGLTSSGTISAGIEQRLVRNSLGVDAYEQSTSGFYRTIMNNGEITGYADRVIKDVNDLNVVAVANEAKRKATLFSQSRDIAPGEYVTIFEPVAVADLVRFLGYTSFGATSKQDGRSFMASKLGQQVMGTNVTIWDDALDPECLMQAFDAEGTPKQKVMLIDRGVAAGVTYDAQTAHREGRQSTGHGASGRRWYGVVPSHMLMATGDMPVDQMIRTTKRGILVTRFHYTHCPDPMRVVATGTTRDGTFLIEDGQIVARLRNLRFTESLLSAFGRISGISPDRRLTRDWWSTFISVLPALRIDGFHFTGATTF